MTIGYVHTPLYPGQKPGCWPGWSRLSLIEKIQRKRIQPPSVPVHEFKIALAIANISLPKFSETIGVSRQAVWQNLHGLKKSRRIRKAMLAFIKDHSRNPGEAP